MSCTILAYDAIRVRIRVRVRRDITLYTLPHNRWEQASRDQGMAPDKLEMEKPQVGNQLAGTRSEGIRRESNRPGNQQQTQQQMQPQKWQQQLQQQ